MQVDRHFRAIVAGLVAVYFALQLAYILRLPVVMDEFDGAYEAYHLRHLIPYRDYVPYKAVLGHYLLLPVAAAVNDIWSRIMAMKIEIATINSLVLLGSAFYLTRFVRKTAVVAALMLLIFCTAFLERSSELRVDMLMAWGGLATMLLLLSRRYGWAGLACGVSFIISQKAAFYFLAANAALLVAFLALERTRAGFRDLVRFNVVFTAIVAAYVGFWSLLAPASVAFRATFLSAAAAGSVRVYDVWGRYWGQILVRNPLYFLLVVAALWRLVVAFKRERSRIHLDVLTFSIVVIALSALYSQPWPYHFVALLPVTLVLHAFFFDAVRIPVSGVVVLIAFGLLYPASRIPVALARDSSYQRYNVRLANAILQPADTYVAGADVVHEHYHAVAALRRLDGKEILALHATDERDLARIVAALETNTPKLFLTSYRIQALPKALLKWINAHYSRITGSIYLYAPMVQQGSSSVPLAFAGRYRIESPLPDRVTIDGRVHMNGEDVHLRPGVHRVSSTHPLRLRLMPDGIEEMLDPQYIGQQEFYPAVYDY